MPGEMLPMDSLSEELEPLWGRDHYHPHVTDEAVETQKSRLMGPRRHEESMCEPRFELRLADGNAHSGGCGPCRETECRTGDSR